MSESSIIEYSLQLPSSDQAVRYTLRGLREDEIDSWSRFCEQVFAYKLPHAPPASYFARHYYNDPHRDASLIRVAICKENDDDDDERIVASCRVFQRTIASPILGQPEDDFDDSRSVIDVAAGGIGEVCTSADHRRRGLSNQLLQQAISTMSNHDSSSAPLMSRKMMTLSFLHSAPTFFPVYQKAGYTSIRSRWSAISISMNNIPDDSQDMVRTASFPDDTASLQALHRQYSESRFVGCIIRSEAYWNEYLSKELEDTLFVLTREDSSILGWMSIRSRNERYQLREFGCLSRETVTRVFLQLLKHSLNLLDASLPETIELHLPTAVLEDITSKGPMEWIGKVEQEDDVGWMYKHLKENVMAIHFNTEKEHLIWPSDSF